VSGCAKLVAIVVALLIITPPLIGLVNALFIPVVVIVVLVLVARMVWFHTRL